MHSTALGLGVDAAVPRCTTTPVRFTVHQMQLAHKRRHFVGLCRVNFVTLTVDSHRYSDTFAMTTYLQLGLR